MRGRIATRGGSTAKGLEVLEREGVGKAMVEAVRVTAEAAGRMGDKGFWKKEDDEVEEEEKERGGDGDHEEHLAQEQEPQDYESEDQKVKAEDTDDADMGK